MIYLLGCERVKGLKTCYDGEKNLHSFHNFRNEYMKKRTLYKLKNI